MKGHQEKVRSKRPPLPHELFSPPSLLMDWDAIPSPVKGQQLTFYGRDIRFPQARERKGDSPTGAMPFYKF